MRFTPLAIPEVVQIDVDPIRDERGAFARVFDEEMFHSHGMIGRFPQWSVSCNVHRGTLRGLHWQADPHGEVKLVRCTHGAIFDVAVDVRKTSPTFGHWIGVELSAENHCALYIPTGFAHGFQTLTDDAEVLYHISEQYYPALARGSRWNDPNLAVAWPDTPRRVISPRDMGLPNLRDVV